MLRAPARKPKAGRIIGPGCKSKKKKLLILPCLVGAAGLLIVAYGLIHDALLPEQSADSQAAPDLQIPVIESPCLEEKSLNIRPGSSFATILEAEGFSPRDIYDLSSSVKPVYDMARIKAGQVMRIFRLPGRSWQTIEYDIDELHCLTIDNCQNGIEAAIKTHPHEIRTAVLNGIVNDSLIAAVAEAGERDSLALDLVESCFAWDIDFYSDLRQGDTFTIYFEKKFIKGVFAGYGNILAAEFINNGRTYRAFRFTRPDTQVADYFDENGDSKRKQFLRSPFKFTPRITSHFSLRRLHPIRKVYRPHYGVDYAAPIGTPVQATADGQVILAAWNGAAGRIVKLQHKNRYQTAYLHLSRFGPGIKKGSSVKTGDIVGYVGSSGESTGPHLDYRIYYRGMPVNPLSHKFKPAEPLDRKFLDEYKMETKRLTFSLELRQFAARPFHFFLMP